MGDSISAGTIGEFGELFMAKVEEMVPDFLNQMEKTWENIGLSYGERARRTDMLVQAAKTMLTKTIKLYDDEYNSLIANIETIGKQVLSLAGELQITSKEPDEHLSALQLEEFLLNYLQELKAEKQRRLDSYESLMVEEETLKSVLGCPSIAQSLEGLPTDQQLHDLRAHVSDMRKEKERRYCTFSALRGIIIRLWNSLKIKPTTQFERDLANAEDSFPLTAASLDAMKSLKDTLEAHLQARKDNAEHLRERCIMLWGLLHIPLQEKEQFLANNMGHSSSMIHSLREEVGNLEIKKTENMQTLISRLREEILMFWDKCLYGKDQKESFLPYYTENCTEEVLDQHEKYLKGLKALHEECHVCFEKVTRLNQLFEKLVAFVTKKDFNGDRFNNRGGALLKEEKERKQVQRLIPKLVTEIKEAVQSWESENSSEFNVYGMPFADFVRSQWDIYEKEKENERIERQLKKARNLGDGVGLSATIGSKRPLMQTGTPCAGRANKISRIITPMSSISRMTPLNRVCTRSILRASNTCGTPLGKPPLSTSKFATQPKRKVVPRRLQQKAANVSQRRLPNPSGSKPIFNPFVARELELTALLPSTNASTYSDFQSKLVQPHAKADLCSTLVQPASEQEVM